MDFYYQFVLERLKERGKYICAGLGLLALFAYEIGEISINSFFINYVVEKVVYTPRNEVNFIYKGNLYELFYWGGGGRDVRDRTAVGEQSVWKAG